MAVVALLTDFGDSEYPGIMKGALLRGCPGAQVLDLFHGVGPQNVREGAWVLKTACPFFPQGTVFLCVVDPGVGSSRRAVAVAAGGFRFTAPDNGLLWPALQDLGEPAAAVRLAVPPGAGATFHGRDVFAPAAARLAAGEPIAALGPPAAPLVPLHFYRDGREGEVVRIDSFGNVVTNLPPVPGTRRYRLGAPQRTLNLYPHYAAMPPGEVGLVVGSAGTLELSLAGSSASACLPLVQGHRITLDPVD